MPFFAFHTFYVCSKGNIIRKMGKQLGTIVILLAPGVKYTSCTAYTWFLYFDPGANSSGAI